MEKIKVNNQIVLMRKYVKQAKVRAINKLTKEVKMLQDRKGNEMQVAKAKRKADRFLEEISLLKKIKPDYVSKLALSKTRNWNEVLKQKTSSLNDRCIALLANYKAVQDEVQCFYSSNPGIVQKIPDLINEWEQKSKLIKDLPKGKRAVDMKKRRIDKNMKEMHSKDKLHSSLSVSDQQIDKINNVLSGNQEKNSDSFQETEEVENNSSLVNKQEHKKQKRVGKQRSLRLNSVESQNEISDIKPSENSESNENLIEEESSESHNNDENSTKYPLRELANDRDGEKSEDSDSMCDEALDLENKMNQNKLPLRKMTNDRDGEKSEDSDSMCDEAPNLENKMNQNKLPLRKMTNDRDGEKSEDTDSICDEAPDLENKINQTKSDNKKILPIKDTSSDFHKNENNKRKLSDVQNVNSSPMKSDCNQSSDFYLNHKKSAKKNSKAIALINLNELEDLDEIPLNKTIEDEDEESDEDERKKLPKRKIDDPFFLSTEELDYANNDILSAKSKNQLPFSKYIHRNDRERDMSFSRREKSFSPNNFRRNFQKSSSHSAFTRNESPKFNYDRNNPFKRGQFQSKYHQDTFQSKEKYGFKKDEIHSKDKNDSSRRERTLHSFRRKSQERHSDKLCVRSESSNSCIKDKGVGRKGDRVDEKTLHPSWEAKKKQKELAQTGFQGKRIVFNE